MLIGPRGKRLHDFTVKINDNTISQTNSTKYLGVYIDDKLTWSDHITNLEKTISRSVGIFYRIRHYLNERAPKSLYFGIVYSHLQYAIGSWGGVGKTSLRRLTVLHNKIIKAMAYSSLRSKLDPQYKYLNLLKVKDLYNLEIGKIMHKIHFANPPDNFKQLFTSLNQIHSYATRSATRGALFWQAASNQYGKRSLKHIGPKIWDCIDPSLYELSSFTFKKTL